ncbi:unnamed protein product, partial [Durusdinium trenchii]
MEFAKAVYIERASKSRTIPLYYLGLSEKEGEKEWQTHHMNSWLSEGFLDGSLALPVGAPALMSKELPAELATSLPPKPELTTLVWSEKKVDGLQTLRTPDKLLQTWHDHSLFGRRNQEWLKATRESVPLDCKEGDKEKAKKSAADVNIAAGTTIAGYYKGSFHMKGGKGKKAEEELEVRETDCQYILEDSSSEATNFKMTAKNLVLFRPENAPTSEEKKTPDGAYQLPLTSMAGCLDT